MGFHTKFGNVAPKTLNVLGYILYYNSTPQSEPDWNFIRKGLRANCNLITTITLCIQIPSSKVMTLHFTVNLAIMQLSKFGYFLS